MIASNPDARESPLRDRGEVWGTANESTRDIRLGHGGENREFPATKLLLVLVAALGAVLRFFRLDFQSLWNDELSSWARTSYGSLSEVITRGTLPDVHPPGYYVLLHLVQKVFGDGEWALRAPSAVFGALTVIAVYSLGRRLYGAREGLIAAALAATLWAPVSVSQEARPYALLVLLATVTMRASYEFMVAIRDDRRLPGAWFAVLVLASAACAYTHYFGLLLVAIEATSCAAVAVMHRRQRAAVLAVYGAVGILYLPWLPSLLHQLRRGSSWISPLRATYLGELPWYLLNRSHLLAGFVAVVVAAALLKTVLSHADSPTGQRDGMGFADRALAWWLLAPVAASAAVSWLIVPVVTHRNLLICLPPCVVLVARCLEMLRPPRWLPASLAVVLVGGSLIDLIAISGYYNTPVNEQFREAVQYVAARSDAVERPPIGACVWNQRYLDYYFRHLGSELRVQWVGCDVATVSSAAKWQQSAMPDRLWFISAHRLPTPAVLAWFRERYLLLDARQFVGAYVLLLERRPLRALGATARDGREDRTVEFPPPPPTGGQTSSGRR